MKKKFAAAVVIGLAFLLPASINTSWQSNGLLNFSGAAALDSEPGAGTNEAGLQRGALCVRLSEFAASRYREGRISVEWRTAFEQGLEGFVIERRENTGSGAFTRCGYVPALGHSQQPQRYRFIDAPPTREVYYYRLRAVDQSGACGYSRETTASE